MREISRVQDKKLGANNELGKTTIATKFPKHLLMAFEKGYSAIPGANAQPINKWSEFRTALKQLKDPELKEMFETVIVDTSDIAYDLCEKYICDNFVREDGCVGVDTVGDIPYGKGYTLVAKEFDECLRSIVSMGYGLVLISHAVDGTFKDEQGKEYNQITPTLGKKPRNIVSRLCDIIGYSRAVQQTDGSTVTKLFMRGTPRFVAGSRFPYTPDVIDFNYKSLVDAIGQSIDKQMAESGAELFTESRGNLYLADTTELDYDALMETFFTIVGQLTTGEDDESSEKLQEYWNPRIVEVIERYLGKGAKIASCARTQTEVLDLIVKDLQDFVN